MCTHIVQDFYGNSGWQKDDQARNAKTEFLLLVLEELVEASADLTLVVWCGRLDHCRDKETYLSVPSISRLAKNTLLTYQLMTNILVEYCRQRRDNEELHLEHFFWIFKIFYHLLVNWNIIIPRSKIIA